MSFKMIAKKTGIFALSLTLALGSMSLPVFAEEIGPDEEVLETETESVTESEEVLEPESGSGIAADPWLIGTTGHESDVTAVFSSGCTLTISGSGAMQDFSWNTQPWYGYKNYITNIIIENGVTNIGNYAFFGHDCIYSIEIPASVTSIGEYAFSDCYDISQRTGLNRVTFSNGSQCTSIGNHAFSGDKGLSHFIVPASVTSIGNNAFYDCGQIYDFSFAENSQCTSIGNEAFRSCNGLRSFTIPMGVRSIGTNVFSRAFLNTVYAPLGLDISNTNIRSEAAIKYMCAVPTATATSFTYDGTEKTLAVTAPTNVGYTLSGDKQTNVGIFTATATLSDPSYVWSDLTTAQKNIARWSITPKEVGLTWGNTNFAYTGSVQTPAATATGLVGNDTCSVTVSGGQSNPGTYTATATGLSNNNYTLPANKTTSFTIGPDPNSNNNQNQNNNQNNNPDPNQNNNQNNNQNEDKKDPVQVNNFVERMYTKALKRASEEGGKNDWATQLLTGKSDGATLAKGFICSDEFVNKDMSNEEFLDTLYETFFDRAADEGGKATWLAKLNEGSSRTSVLAGFVNSAEFGNLCESFGIARGTMEEDGSSIYNEGVYNFVKRNYTKTLGRNGEIAGIEDWCHRINTGQLTMKDVAVEFLHSTEFLNKNTSNEEYVTVLYHTFMDREPDAAGLADWVGQLDRGEKTRDEIVNGFADSVEFAAIMAQYQ